MASSGLLDGRIARPGRSSGALGASGACLGEFRWTGRRADQCTNSTKPSPDTHGRELAWFTWALPGKADVINVVASKAERGEHGGHEPRPPLGLGRRAQ